jgi:hypothetical protein
VFGVAGQPCPQTAPIRPSLLKPQSQVPGRMLTNVQILRKAGHGILTAFHARQNLIQDGTIKIWVSVLGTNRARSSPQRVGWLPPTVCPLPR